MKTKIYSPEEIEKKIAEKGLQATLQRISLCQYLMNEADHPTAEDVYSWAQKNLAKISQATVYNTLGALTEAGLIRTFKFPHSEKVVYDSNIDDHFHFFDEKSGKLLDVETSSVKVTVDLPKKFKVKTMDIILNGEIKS